MQKFKEWFKKPFYRWLLASIVMMIAVPAVLTPAMTSESGLLISFVLLLVADPIYMVFVGAGAGKDPRHLATLPLISAALFVPGAWISFSAFEMDFFIYAAGYAIIGYVSLLVVTLADKRIAKRAQRLGR